MKVFQFFGHCLGVVQIRRNPQRPSVRNASAGIAYILVQAQKQPAHDLDQSWVIRNAILKNNKDDQAEALSQEPSGREPPSWIGAVDKRSVIFMRMISSALAILAVLAATEAASAQSINLTGAYRCVEACRAGLVGAPAFITQNGRALNLLNEAGAPSRAWPDWFAPTSRIWVDAWHEGAVYSPDGVTVQFDNGTIWVRDFGPPPPAPRRRN